VQKQLPPAATARGDVTYDKSGWCTFENAAAGLSSSHGGKRFVLGQNRLWPSAALPPPPPGKMAAKFADEEQTIFIGKADREEVSKMYADLYVTVRTYDEAKRRSTRVCIDRLVNTPRLLILAFVLWFGLIGGAVIASPTFTRTSAAGPHPNGIIAPSVVAGVVVVLFPVVLILGYSATARRACSRAKVKPSFVDV